MKNIFTIIRNNIYLLLLTAVSAGFSIPAFATNHIVTAQNYFFSPTTLNVTVGDSVTWHFNGGVEHEPKSVTIPAGAATWDQIISPSQTDFSYVVTVAGVYNYECFIHVSEGMVASFTASAATGIESVEENLPLKVFPIPFQQNLTIDLNNNGSFKNSVTIEVSNTIGQRKFYLTSTEILSAPLTIDLSDLSTGIYFLSVSDGINKKTLRLVKSE